MLARLTVLQVNMRYASIDESDFAISVNVVQFYIATVSSLFVGELNVLGLFRIILFNSFTNYSFDSHYTLQDILHVYIHGDS